MTATLTTLLLASFVLVAPADAVCTAKRCGIEQRATIDALRAEIDATCDCAGSANHRAYTRCAKAAVRTAVREGRVSKACGKAVRKCETRSTCGREGAVVCCKQKKGETVGRVRPSAAKCGAGTVCTDQPRASDACAPGGRCCRSLVERGPPDVIVPGSGLEVVSGFEVRAIGPEGCADLEGPLVALNYFSFTDRETYLRYGAAVIGVLQAFGHRPMTAGRRLESFIAPPGRPSNGGAYDHEEFALAWYASAGGFLDFIRSEAQQEISADREAGARQSDYVWGMQRCLLGCTEVPQPAGELLMAHIFRYEGNDLDAGIEALTSAPGAPEVFYAGETVAELRVRIGELSINPQKPPWGRGAIVFRIASRDAALAWLGDTAYTAFRSETAEDVVMLLAAGL